MFLSRELCKMYKTCKQLMANRYNALIKKVIKLTISKTRDQCFVQAFGNLMFQKSNLIFNLL